MSADLGNTKEDRTELDRNQLIHRWTGKDA